MDFWDEIINNYEEEKNPIPVIKGIQGREASFEKLPESAEELSISFVDGGNSTLFSAPNFIYAKLRVGIATFKGRNKLKEEKKDFDVYCYDKNGWKARVNEEIFEFNTSQILDGGRENPDKIPQMIRRILEIRTARKESNNDFVILDGTLDATFEEEEIKLLPRNVLALSKTNTIRTVKGNSYTGILANIAPETFIAKNIFPNLSFVKLSKSPYVFRIDGILDERLIYWLKIHAEDPAIKGYPYGLISADRAARISDYELKAMKVKTFTELGKKAGKIREILAGKDIHEFLDGQNIY